jgi:hypothetical protein
MWIVPAWRVRASLAPVPPGGSAVARAEHILLEVADNDLEAVLRTLRRNGYEKIMHQKERGPLDIPPQQVEG